MVRRLVSSFAAIAIVLGTLAPAEAGGWRYQNNGRCDDPRYETSHGGRAQPGTDEYDCSRWGNGLKGRYSDDHGYGYGGGYGYDRYDDDDGFDLGGDDLGTAAAILGGIAVLGILSAMAGSGETEAPRSNGIIWNDANASGPPRALTPERLSACQQTVRDGIAQRLGAWDVTFSGFADEGIAYADGRAFNFRCAAGQINVWE